MCKREIEKERNTGLCLTLPKKIIVPSAFELLFQVSTHRLFHESDIVTMPIFGWLLFAFFCSIPCSFFLDVFLLSNFPFYSFSIFTEE